MSNDKNMVLTSNDLLMKIAGSVVISSTPGLILKSWRERLKIKQVILANHMNVSSSVLSDYENGRRISPGIGFIKRYLESLLDIDKNQGNFIEKQVEALDTSAIMAIGEFKNPVSAKTIVESLESTILCGANLQHQNIFGYTVLDSIKTLYSLSGSGFYNIFGSTSERVIVFTKVGLGRSPIVAIRVSQLKPRMVVLHGPKVVDPLAIDLAKKENIILSLSSMASEHDFAPKLQQF